MSDQVSIANIQTYSTNVQLLLQQKMSKLRGSVMEQAIQGKRASVVEQIGSVNPTWNAARHSDTEYSSTPHAKRWVLHNSARFADLTDVDDLVNMLIDPTSQYVSAAAAAMNRAFDDIILGGIFQSNYTGEDGTTSTGLLSAYNSGSQVIASTFGGSSATGLNLAKLMEARRLLAAADVDDSEEIYVAVSSKQWYDLMNETKIVSKDYIVSDALATGVIPGIMGFKFIRTERIPGGSKFDATAPGNSTITGYTTGSLYLCPFWCKSGVILGVGKDINVSVDRMPGKNNSTQILAHMIAGATRTEELKCGIITCA